MHVNREASIDRTHGDYSTLFTSLPASGKDKSVFVTKQDVDKTEFVKELVEEDTHGIILPSGEINWDCPCLGNLPQGSCGGEFKAAFSCFHYRCEADAILFVWSGVCVCV